jgi:hypothetical protein
LYSPYNVIVTLGEILPGAFSEFEKVKSGNTRHTKPKLCPSPISNSD